ncbi:MAG TPA: Ig-like domain-containing protein [Vicinamibacterales bacterium]|nr:Ig-like domain-containing protein [Vicinamibacterales bacterium]
MGLTLLALVVSACEKVPLLAPTGSTITLTTPSNTLSANGTADIVAQVLEAAGTPPHSGTHVSFTTTLGRIEPADASTDANGRVTVKFVANGASGTAIITAASGGATTGSSGAVRIAVGAAAVGRVIVVASPNPVSANGGVATVTSNVVDINGNALAGVAVSFSTTAGALGSSLVNTDAAGIAQTTLTTSTQATVTATVGVSASSSSGSTGTGSTGTTGTGSTGSTSTQVSGSVTVNVTVAPTILITPPSTPPNKGLPATYTIVVTAAAQNGNPVRNVSVDWGDGTVNDLGSFTGSQPQTHVYSRDGSFLITATVTDVAGNSNTARTSVTVIPVPRPTVTVTATPQTVTVNGTVTFNIQVLPPTGIGVQRTSISYGDGVTEDLGGATSVTRTHQYTSAGQKAVLVTVLDTAGQTTEGTTSVSVTP